MSPRSHLAAQHEETPTAPLNLVIHVDLPWMMIVTETFPGYDIINFHYDKNTCEAEDFNIASKFLGPFASRLGSEPSSCLDPASHPDEIWVRYRQITG